MLVAVSHVKMWSTPSCPHTLHHLHYTVSILLSLISDHQVGLSPARQLFGVLQGNRNSRFFQELVDQPTLVHDMPTKPAKRRKEGGAGRRRSCHHTKGEEGGGGTALHSPAGNSLGFGFTPSRVKK